MVFAMRYSRFDLSLLNALDALLQERNVTRAAERLFVTQPSMSGTLQRLRDYFQDPLLVRSGRDMELTPRGISLIEPVRELVLQTKISLDSHMKFDPVTAKRTFRLTMSDYVSVVFAHTVLRRIKNEAPNIRLHIQPLTRDCFTDMAAGQADLCITTDNFRLFQTKDVTELLHSEPLFSDTFVCVVADDHPTITDELTLEQYLELPHILTRFSENISTIEEHMLKGMDHDVIVGATAPGFVAPLFMLPGTELIATVQKKLAAKIAPSLPVKVFDPPIDIPVLNETLAWHSRSNLDPAHIWLRGFLKQAVKDI